MGLKKNDPCYAGAGDGEALFVVTEYCLWAAPLVGLWTSLARCYGARTEKLDEAEEWMETVLRKQSAAAIDPMVPGSYTVNKKTDDSEYQRLPPDTLVFTFRAKDRLTRPVMAAWFEMASVHATNLGNPDRWVDAISAAGKRLVSLINANPEQTVFPS